MRYLSILFSTAFALLLTTNINASDEIETSYSELPKKDVKGLLHMVEEEKLARDVYLKLYKKWKMPIFNKISQSEQRHMDAVRSLLKKYSIDDPTNSTEQGKFVSEELQKLYKQLVNKGCTSEQDALMVGATIEDLDINDLNKLIAESKNEAVKLVYTRINNGSMNHMRAFSNELKKLKATYIPQFISLKVYEDIISKPINKCDKKPKCSDCSK